jgi:ribosomal protein S18 acetylase RimI-like enzyme
MRLEAGASPSPGILLRDALPGDEALLRSLYRSTRDPELRQTDWSEEQRVAFANSQFDLQDRWYRENYPGVQFLVIEQDGVAIGRLYLHATTGDLNLMDITLAAAVRNRGLGSSLVRWLQELARAQGDTISLHVESFNPARRLYARLGFAEVSEEEVYVRMRWTPGPGGGRA